MNLQHLNQCCIIWHCMLVQSIFPTQSLIVPNAASLMRTPLKICSSDLANAMEFKVEFNIILNIHMQLLENTLTDYLRFYVPLKNFSFIWKRHHWRWRAVKFRPMLGAHGLWARRDLYRATSAVTRDLGFSGLIRRTALFNRLLRHTKGCGGF
jgi:hypothetical protein